MDLRSYPARCAVCVFRLPLRFSIWLRDATDDERGRLRQRRFQANSLVRAQLTSSWDYLFPTISSACGQFPKSKVRFPGSTCQDGTERASHASDFDLRRPILEYKVETR